jgi:hypothetical protein
VPSPSTALQVVDPRQLRGAEVAEVPVPGPHAQQQVGQLRLEAAAELGVQQVDQRGGPPPANQYEAPRSAGVAHGADSVHTGSSSVRAAQYFSRWTTNRPTSTLIWDGLSGHQVQAYTVKNQLLQTLSTR